MENKMPKLWNFKCRYLWNLVYRLHYDEIAEYNSIPETLDKEHISKDTVLQLLEYDSLIVHMDGRIAWSCESFIEENGIAFEWVDGEVKMIVPFSDYMYS